MRDNGINLFALHEQAERPNLVGQDDAAGREDFFLQMRALRSSDFALLSDNERLIAVLRQINVRQKPHVKPPPCQNKRAKLHCVPAVQMCMRVWRNQVSRASRILPCRAIYGKQLARCAPRLFLERLLLWNVKNRPC